MVMVILEVMLEISGFLMMTKMLTRYLISFS